jgi:hypothetical protein
MGHPSLVVRLAFKNSVLVGYPTLVVRLAFKNSVVVGFWSGCGVGFQVFPEAVGEFGA